MGAGSGPSFMKSGALRAVLGVAPFVVSCLVPGSVLGAPAGAGEAPSLRLERRGSDFGAVPSLRVERSGSDFGAGFRFSDLGAPVEAVGARMTFPHWGQETSLKSCSGAMSKE